MTQTAADRDDFFRVIPIDPFDPHPLSKNLGREGTRQVFLQHAQKPHSLFRFAVRIDNGVLDECLEPLLADSRTSGHRRIPLRGHLIAECPRPAVRRELADEPLRMGGHTQQDIFEVHVRREVNQFAALHERIE